MSVYNLDLDSLVDIDFVCSVCQNDFEPPKTDCICCDKCEKWFHLDCCGVSEHEFNFYVNNEDPFYCVDCVNNLGLTNVGSDDFCKCCFKKFSNLDDCLFFEGCFRWTHLECSTVSIKEFAKMCKNDLPFFCETCEQKMSVCFKCKLSCSNLNNSLTCFLCLHKCHVLLKINLN